MEIIVFIIGMGVTIVMVLILLSGFMQDMDWYDNKAAFEDVRKPAAPSKRHAAAPRKVPVSERKVPVSERKVPVSERKVPVSERKPLTQLIKWMDYHVE